MMIAEYAVLCNYVDNPKGTENLQVYNIIITAWVTQHTDRAAVIHACDSYVNTCV